MAPISHVAGTKVLPTLMRGGTVHMLKGFDPEAVFKTIEREKINQIGGVPTIAWQVIEHPRAGEYDLSVGAIYSFLAIVCATVSNSLMGDIAAEGSSAVSSTPGRRRSTEHITPVPAPTSSTLAPGANCTTRLRSAK